MPDEERLPPGPRRDLTLALRSLYEAAARPSVRAICQRIELLRRSGEAVNSLSPDTVNKALAGRGVPRWGTVDALVQSLVAMRVVGEATDPEAVLDQTLALWIPADRTRSQDRPDANAEILEAARAAALDAVVSMFSEASQISVSYFQADGDKPNRKIVRVDGRGRRGTHRRTFEETVESDAPVVKRLDLHQSSYYSDRTPAPAGWNRSPGYRSFIAVPVAANDRLFGMLTLEASQADAFAHPRFLAGVTAVAKLYSMIRNAYAH